MLKIKSQHGYTVIELIMIVWILFVLSTIGGLIYVAIHFLAKYW